MNSASDKLPGDNRREFDRFESPTLIVHFDGITYETDDWSLSGLRIKGYDGFRPSMSMLKVTAMGLSGETPDNVDVQATVTRIDDEHDTLSLRYVVLDYTASIFLAELALGPNFQKEKTLETL